MDVSHEIRISHVEEVFPRWIGNFRLETEVAFRRVARAKNTRPTDPVGQILVIREVHRGVVPTVHPSIAERDYVHGIDSKRRDGTANSIGNITYQI